MKKHNVIEFVLVGLLVCTALSCKSSSSANLNEGSNGNYNSATLAANANGVKETPVPAAASCPEGELTLSPNDFIDRRNKFGDRFGDRKAEKYVGCKVFISNKLMAIYPTSVVLMESIGDNIGKEKISCYGNFSGETFTKISQKLAGLSEGADWAKFPTVRFSGKVKQVEGTSNFELTECVMIMVLSGGN